MHQLLRFFLSLTRTATPAPCGYTRGHDVSLSRLVRSRARRLPPVSARTRYTFRTANKRNGYTVKKYPPKYFDRVRTQIFPGVIFVRFRKFSMQLLLLPLRVFTQLTRSYYYARYILLCVYNTRVIIASKKKIKRLLYSFRISSSISPRP